MYKWLEAHKIAYIPLLSVVVTNDRNSLEEQSFASSSVSKMFITFKAQVKPSRTDRKSIIFLLLKTWKKIKK